VLQNLEHSFHKAFDETTSAGYGFPYVKEVASISWREEPMCSLKQNDPRTMADETQPFPFLTERWGLECLLQVHLLLSLAS